MAALQDRNGSFRLLFRYDGKQHTFTIGEVSRPEAEAKAAQAEYLLMRLKQRLVTLPPGTDVVAFLKHDGKPPEPAPMLPESPRRAVTISALKDRYLVTHGNGTLEANSLATCDLHLSHAARVLGGGLPLADLTLARMQEYVSKRAAAGVAPVTVRKEVATLRAAWNWGGPMGLTQGAFPSRGLRYPKTDEKPPFMTLAEVGRRVAAGADGKAVWECLYLTADEVAELLAHVRGRAAHPWLYPLFAFAAHTGARRSEIMRATADDVDLDAGVVTVREKKRSRGQRTTRRVPLTPFLKGILTDWLRGHPGGPLFGHAGAVARSKKRSPTTGHLGEKTRAGTLKGRAGAVTAREQPARAPLTRTEIHDHFRRVLKNTKWENVRGLHTLRHSFVSACATRGIDQRLVMEWAGHMDEETSRRYRHLYPSAQSDAIGRVFG